MSLKKGDVIVATANGYGWKVSGYGQRVYTKGEEFEVTSTRSEGFVNVKPFDKYGDRSVFKIPLTDVRPAPRMVGQVPPGGISAEDPRVAWIFEDAARMADRLGLCGDFDRLCDAIGLPGRMRKFSIKLAQADGVVVTARVEARSKKLAEQRVRGISNINPPAPLILEAAHA